MGSKHVRLDEDVYAWIEARKREDETFSEAVDRLTSEWSLAEWGRRWSDHDAGGHRALLEDVERATAESLDETVAEFEDG